jgi:hypothetical protein
VPREKIGKDEKTVKNFLDDIDQEMDMFKEENISKGWNEIPDFYRGNSQWGEERPSHKLSPVLNFVQQSIERKVSQMTDTKPYMDILPYHDPLNEVAQALEAIVASKWSEQSLDMTLTDVVFFSELYGTCGVNTCYDKMIDDITVKCVDPRCLNFDPMVMSSQDLWMAEYVRLDTVLPTSLLKQKYPAKASEIQDDAPFTFKKPVEKGLTGRQVRKPISHVRGNKGAIKRSIVKEYWLKDRSMARGKEKYPGGRHITVGGGAIVQDGANPYWDSRHPIDILDWHRNPDSAWGQGDVLGLMELQRLINKLIAVVSENGILMTNAIWMGDSNALTAKDWDALDNVPGLKVKKRPGSKLERVSPPPLSQSVFQLIAYLEKALEKLSGHTEVVQGKSPGEVKSGIAIEALQTAAMSLIRLKARSLESLIERAGQKLIARIFQYETNDRMMWRVAGGEEYEAFQFFRAALTDKTKFPNGPKDAWKDFLFKIRPGSSLSQSNWQKSLVAMQMYSAQPEPLIDRQAVLETMDWPGRYDIQKRLDEKKSDDMQIAMIMSGMGSGGGMPGKPGGSAPKVTDINSPHAAQGMIESQRKNNMA